MRVINHFYDPYNDRGFTAVGQFGYRAPDWALEDTREFPDQNHSYRDARAAFYLGLTAPDKATRERNLGYTFYALGHVMHLIQDLAQPQHARNDFHLIFTPRTSLLEAYINGLVQQGRLAPSGDVDPAAVLGKIARVRDLWATGTGAAMGRLGMAAFTNASFVSANTNFNDLRHRATGGGFPDPKLDLLQISSLTSNAQCKDGVRPPLGFPLTFYGNRFSDPIKGGEIENDRMTTYSIFDQHLHAQNAGLIFALNCFNLDRVADILIQRAVSYSAALLDYFFRGRLDVGVQLQRVTDPVTGVPTDQVSAAVVITNGSSDETMTGAFAVYYDAADGTRRPLASSTGAITLAPGDATVLDVPSLPLDMPLTAWTVVFRGALGSEADAVVGRRIGPAYLVSLSYYRAESSTDQPGSTSITERDSGFGPFGFLLVPGASLGTGAGEMVSRGAELGGTVAPNSFGFLVQKSAVLLALDPDVIPDGRLTVEFPSPSNTFCSGFQQDGPPFTTITYFPLTPSSGELVELEPAPDLRALLGYTFLEQPNVRRVLLAFSGADSGSVPVDVRGVRLLGLRLTTHPPDPGPVSAEGVGRRGIIRSCQASLNLLVP